MSYCVVILRVPPYWSVRVASCHLKLAGNSFHCQSCTTSDMTSELGIALGNDLKDFCVETSCQSYYQWAKPFWLAGVVRESGSVSTKIGSLNNYDDDHNDDFKKRIGLMIKSTLFTTFLWRPLHDCDAKPSNNFFFFSFFSSLPFFSFFLFYLCVCECLCVISYNPRKYNCKLLLSRLEWHFC